MQGTGFKSSHNIMSIEKFCALIKGKVQNKLGAEFRVIIQESVKSNNVKLWKLIVMEQGRNVLPTICLTCYYREYQKGRSLEVAEREILENLWIQIRS